MPRAIRAAIFVLLLVFFATMLWLGAALRDASTWGQTTPVMQIPIGAVYLAMPIGFALLIVHLLLMAVPYVRQRQLPGRCRIRRGRGEDVIAALFVGCIVLLALGVPVAFALGGGTLVAILVHGGLPLDRAARSTCSAGSTCSR